MTPDKILHTPTFEQPQCSVNSLDDNVPPDEDVAEDSDTDSDCRQHGHKQEQEQNCEDHEQLQQPISRPWAKYKPPTEQAAGEAIEALDKMLKPRRTDDHGFEGSKLLKYTLERLQWVWLHLATYINPNSAIQGSYGTRWTAASAHVADITGGSAHRVCTPSKAAAEMVQTLRD